MSLGPRFWTRASAEYAEEMVKAVADFTADADAGARVGHRACKTCFYLKRGRMAGQAFTSWSCAYCDAPQPDHPNTNVPRVCASCSDQHALCVRCGGDIDLIEDRSAFPVPIDRRTIRRQASSDREGT